MGQLRAADVAHKLTHPRSLSSCLGGTVGESQALPSWSSQCSGGEDRLTRQGQHRVVRAGLHRALGGHPTLPGVAGRDI